jgi:serine/threonine-protein kinase
MCSTSRCSEWRGASSVTASGWCVGTSWAGVLGAVLGLTLLLGLAAIHAKQNAAVTGLALDFGSSLGRMVASESAEDLLLGDRAATRALVEDIARNRQIHYLAIADRYGEVIGSTQREQVGHR